MGLLLVGGCGGVGLGQTRSCTLIGALDGISLRLSPPSDSSRSRVRVEVCQGGTCRSGVSPLRPGTDRVEVPLSRFAQSFDAGAATVGISLEGRGGRAVTITREDVVLERSFPNGRECDGDGFLNATIRLDLPPPGPR